MAKLQQLILIFILVTFSACASRPHLYPNDKLKQVGKEQGDKDIEECQQLASEYMSSGQGKEIAAGAGRGAVVGGATGAVFGALTGNVGRGALFGGAVGAASGGAHAAVSPDQVKRNFVNQCLHDRGYRVIGWK